MQEQVLMLAPKTAVPRSVAKSLSAARARVAPLPKQSPASGAGQPQRATPFGTNHAPIFD